MSEFGYSYTPIKAKAENLDDYPIALTARTVSWWRYVAVQAAKFSLFVLFMTVWSILLLGYNKPGSCISITSEWSPLLSNFGDEIVTRKFDRHFYTNNLYKGPPSEERDKAWDDLLIGDSLMIIVSDRERARVNAPADAIKRAAEFGGGYLASTEVLHQLHCLRSLRQSTYPEYYNVSGYEVGTPHHRSWRLHLDNLREKVMCDADVGLVFYHWVKRKKTPIPIFSGQHKCRDFSKVAEGLKRIGLDVEPEKWSHDDIASDWDIY